MSAGAINLVLSVVGDATTTEHEIADGALSLRKEVDGLCEEVRQISEPGVPGSKAVDPLTLGALALVIAPTALPALVNVVKAWVGRRQAQRVKLTVTRGDQSTSIEYDPTTMTREEVEDLVNGVVQSMRTKTLRT